MSCLNRTGSQPRKEVIKEGAKSIRLALPQPSVDAIIGAGIFDLGGTAAAGAPQETLAFGGGYGSRSDRHLLCPELVLGERTGRDQVLRARACPRLEARHLSITRKYQGCSWRLHDTIGRRSRSKDYLRRDLGRTVRQTLSTGHQPPRDEHKAAEHRYELRVHRTCDAHRSHKGHHRRREEGVGLEKRRLDVKTLVSA